MISSKQLESRCVSLMEQHGFKGKSGVVTRELSDGFYAWVGFNIGAHPTFRRINPNIGVHCVPVMKFVAAAKGKRYEKLAIATYAVPLGHVAPEVDQFVIRSDSDIDEELGRLGRVISERGEPYMRTLSSYDALIPHLMERIESLGGNPERLVAAYIVSGAHDKAMALIQDLRKKFEAENNSQSILAEFNKFAEFSEEQIRRDAER